MQRRRNGRPAFAPATSRQAVRTASRRMPAGAGDLDPAARLLARRRMQGRRRPGGDPVLPPWNVSPTGTQKRRSRRRRHRWRQSRSAASPGRPLAPSSAADATDVKVLDKFERPTDWGTAHCCASSPTPAKALPSHARRCPRLDQDCAVPFASITRGCRTRNTNKVILCIRLARRCGTRPRPGQRWSLLRAAQPDHSTADCRTMAGPRAASPRFAAHDACGWRIGGGQ